MDGYCLDFGKFLSTRDGARSHNPPRGNRFHLILIAYYQVVVKAARIENYKKTLQEGIDYIQKLWEN